MSNTRSSGLRRPCFQDKATEAWNSLNSSHVPLHLTDFTKASHRRLLLPHDRDATEHDDEGNSGTAPSADKENATESKKDDPSMNQCIALLEPHLVAFRDNCNASARQRVGETAANGNDTESNSDENCDEVPSQLLRVARFFTWRWLPIKKALLRSPPRFHDLTGSQAAPGGDLEQEVELGVTYRLRLAKACWKKGLLAAAEYESLCASLESRKRCFLDDESRENKRHKSYQCDEHNLTERVRLALMRLPTEVVANERAISAWRHAREMLLEFCKQLTDDANTKEDADEAMCQVADWALTSWTALVISQGMDTYSTSSMNQSSSQRSILSIEKQFAILLSSREASSNTLKLTRSVATRINDLLSPDNLKLLNGIHLFSLGKLLSRFTSLEVAEEHIGESVKKCALIGGMVGMEQLSRLLAVYTCSIGAMSDRTNLNGSRNSEMAIAGLERRLLARFDDVTCYEIGSNEKNHHRYSSISKDQNRDEMRSFLKVVLHAAAHLIRSIGR